ncbi:MAG: hypothetical protein ACQKBW_04625, partial [Puniceicoccales bacterium]
MLVIASLGAATLNAAVFEDDFSAYEPGASLQESPAGKERWGRQTHDPAAQLTTLVVQEDGKNALEISDLSNANEQAFFFWPQGQLLEPTQTGFFQCTFSDPKDAPHQGLGFVLRLAGSPGNTKTAFA